MSTFSLLHPLKIWSLRDSRGGSSKALLPLFDAIVNAIHAIQERASIRAGSGRITIRIRRDNSQATLPGEGGRPVEPPVDAFEIADDGIGFDEENLTSFNTADSHHKKSKGSKGVGRFLWLKAFDRVRIVSRFSEAPGRLMDRSFDFELPDGIAREKLLTAPHQEASMATGTTVYLEGLREPYRRNCPKSAEAIVSRIVDHCFTLLMGVDPPHITLEDGPNRFDVTQIAQTAARNAGPAKTFVVKEHEFAVRHFKITSPSAKARVHYLGNEREVVSEPHVDPDLNQRIIVPGEEPFVLVSYVSGAGLDANLNQERTSFTLPSRADTLFSADLSFDDVRDATAGHIREFAAPMVEPLKKTKFEAISRAIQDKFPQYRPLVAKHRDEIEKIPPGLTDERLEVELHKIRAKLTLDTKNKVSDILRSADFDRYEEQFGQVLTQLNEVGKAALIENIVHRKLVLDILSKHLQRRSEGKPGFYLEEDIHRIIFPMQATSDEVPFESQNLWIVDETLTYHRYLASDKRLDQMEPMEGGDGDRPDIVIWNRPFALSESPNDGTYSSVVVLEFKRPQRATYKESEDGPSEQVIRYVRKIQEDKAEDRVGRPLRVHASTPFYAYVLADLTPALVGHLIDAGFHETPDRNGFYFYNSGRRTWIQVISYDKLISDAKRRNRALFEALDLPSA